jgi:catechol 2,3-dioxygenase-like lactoylglutathione lyase family enzyme
VITPSAAWTSWEHGDPFAWFAHADDSHHVVYRAGDGSLHELWYFLGSDDVGHSALTAAYGGRSLTAPSTSHPRAPNQHAAYRGNDGHIHELLR